MKKTALIVMLLMFSVFGAEAQILWKISGNGLERPSYLLGTHHVAPVTVLDSLSGFGDILAGVDKVYGELVMSESNTPAAQQLMAMAAMAPADSTLSKVFSPAQMDSLIGMLQSYMGPQVTADAFEPFKPAMVSTVISMAQAQRIFPGFDPSRQLDTEIQSRAKALGKEIGGLETVEQQCAVLFGGSVAGQASDLLDAVRDEEYAIEMARKLATAYIEGDLKTILAIIEDPRMVSSDATDRLINRRNADWVRVLAALLPTASVLIAVGAGHLPGDKGLITLLRREGYTVEKV